MRAELWSHYSEAIKIGPRVVRGGQTVLLEDSSENAQVDLGQTEVLGEPR